MSDDKYACLCCSPLMAELFKSGASIAELEKRWSASEHTTNWFQTDSALNRRDFVWGGAAFAGAAGLMPVAVQGQETKVRVFAGGTILTVDQSFSEAQAIAIQGNKIIAVGREVDVRKAAGQGGEVIDLKGRVIEVWVAEYTDGTRVEIDPGDLWEMNGEAIVAHLRRLRIDVVRLDQ